MESSENFELLLRTYYKKLFPCNALCKWLSCGPGQGPETVLVDRKYLTDMISFLEENLAFLLRVMCIFVIRALTSPLLFEKNWSNPALTKLISVLFTVLHQSSKGR